MDQITDDSELKRQALRTLAEGREEFSTEVSAMREQLSPGRVLKRVADRHAGLLVVLAVGAGVIPALLLVRRKRPHRTLAVAGPPPKPVISALLIGAAGLFARSLAPLLIKSVILPRVHDFLTKKQPETTKSSG